MKALILATALCAASTLSFAQTSGNQTGSPAGNGLNGQVTAPGAAQPGAGNTDVTGSISNNGATRSHDSVNEPIRRCGTYGDLSQPSRYGAGCE